ncbi:hypothetical protein [Parageobacillus thermoglucosidasius]|uniref:hypothetical protein n=1 Tax=Parageobacillus thermoglucosidasius TaxID=1426 RepID=UPI001FCA6D5B|nr:hypothetical protein [Parageobacillus thermoglucosidasius]BDG30447.1 hypothetical protein PthBH41_01590 [Parageobacillus thermoglucosidasius]
MSDFKFKNEPQKIDYDLYSKLTPSSHMELIDGNLYWSAEERENLLRLLIYNVGIRRTLEIIQEHREENDKDEDEDEYDINKIREHIREIFHPEKPIKIPKYQRPKPPMIVAEKLFKALSKKRC